MAALQLFLIAVLGFCIAATGYAVWQLWKTTTWAERRRIIRQFRQDLRGDIHQELEAWR